LVDIWKENVLEDLEEGVREYEFVRDFLAAIKKEFGEEEEELVKVAELKRLEKRERIIEDFVQKFKRTAKESRYEERSLVKKFKRVINGMIRRKLIEAEKPPLSIKQ